MSGFPRDKLARLIARSEMIQAELKSGRLASGLCEAHQGVLGSRTRGGRHPELEADEQEAQDLEAMMADPAADKDMAELAREDLDRLKPD